jgi:predicted DNA-binding protein (MmcQ/YjbR family)
MFHWVVKYLLVLKHVPLFSLVFDNGIRVWNCVFYPEMNRYLDDIEQTLNQWPDVAVSIHKYGGMQFHYHGKEMGHIHSNGLVDILYPVSLKQKLLKQGTVQEHHLFTKGGWISFQLQSAADKDQAIALLHHSYEHLTKIILLPEG